MPNACIFKLAGYCLGCLFLLIGKSVVSVCLEKVHFFLRCDHTPAQWPICTMVIVPNLCTYVVVKKASVYGF